MLVYMQIAIYVHILIRGALKKYIVYIKADWDSIHEELTYLSENYFRLKEDASRNVEQIVISSMKVFYKLCRSLFQQNKGLQLITDLPWMTCKLKHQLSCLGRKNSV